ncbi:MAG: hypothetical protein HZB26_13340 [Candidatus Hydrogenedentes bacterium]|nr:hypothetical protein [Candidatus Hydrogenedentota bacterium]
MTSQSSTIRRAPGFFLSRFRRPVVFYALSILLISAGTACATRKDVPEEGKAYRPGIGEYTVVVAETSLHDAARNKDVYMRIFIPQGVEHAPVIVHSHGAGDSKDSPSALFQHWCTHGYVCVVPSHARPDEPKGSFRVKRLVHEFKGISKQGPAYFADRVADLKLIMDHLDTLENDVPELRGRMDKNRIGISGHSLGTYTVLAMGGAIMFDKDGKSIDYADRRPRAVLGLSGPRLAMCGLNEKSYATLNRPLMVMSGSLDPGPVVKAIVQRKRTLFSELPRGDKYLIDIRGANHVSYVGPLVRSDKRVAVPETGARSPIERGVKGTSSRPIALARSGWTSARGAEDLSKSLYSNT